MLIAGAAEGSLAITRSVEEIIDDCVTTGVAIRGIVKIVASLG